MTLKAKPNYLPYAESEAAMLLAGAIEERARERISLRELGRRLEYKQPVVLSHMATGRVPIPVDRAIDIARTVGLSPRKFLLSVLQQRHPNIEWSLLTEPRDDFVVELETLAGKSLEELSGDTKDVLRQAVTDARPARRWLTTAELAIVELLRDLRPSLRSAGLSKNDRRSLRTALSNADGLYDSS